MTCSDTSAHALYDLIGAHRITAVIYVTARLRIADFLADGPLTPRELATKSGADEQSLRRLLRALVTISVCRQHGSEQFALSEMGAHLAGNAMHSLKAWAIFEGEALWRSWGGLLDSVCTGKTLAQLVGEESSFELMKQNPQAVETFNAAMADLTRLVTPDVLSAYDFSGIIRIIDVGGGSGELLASILKAYPSVSGAVLDLPRCAERARQHLSNSGVADRGAFIAGNFFDAIPHGADAIIMKSTIHNWDDNWSTRILENCRKALPKSGKLILVERLMPETPEVDAKDRANALSDLNMLRGPGGAERTEPEYRKLLVKNGFAITSVSPAGRFSVIEAIAS